VLVTRFLVMTSLGAALAGCSSTALEQPSDGGADAASDTTPPDPCGTTCAGTMLGGRCLVTLATAIANDIAVTSQAVFWTTIQDGVRSVPICGGPVTTFAPDASNVGLAADAANVYFVSRQANPAGQLAKCAASGCAGGATILSSGPTPTSIAVDATSVYWTDATGNVLAMPVAGGAPRTIASGQPLPTSLLVFDGNVYWRDVGCTPDGGTCGSRLMTAPIGGGAPTAAPSCGPVSCSLPNVTAVAIDRENVYFATYDGSIVEQPITGGAATTLATSQQVPTAIAFDATSVYWTTEGRTVMRLTPK